MITRYHVLSCRLDADRSCKSCPQVPDITGDSTISRQYVIIDSLGQGSTDKFAKKGSTDRPHISLVVDWPDHTEEAGKVPT